MACCNNEKRKDKDYVKSLAVRYSEEMEVDVVLHVFSLRGVGKKIYDFTENKESVGSHGFVELIEFRGNKSESILSDTESVIGDTDRTETVREPIPKRIKRKSAKVKPKMGISDELAEKEPEGNE